MDEFALDVNKMEGIILGTIKRAFCENAAESQEGLGDGQALDMLMTCHGRCRDQGCRAGDEANEIRVRATIPPRSFVFLI